MKRRSFLALLLALVGIRPKPKYVATFDFSKSRDRSSCTLCLWDEKALKWKFYSYNEALALAS